MTTTLHNQAVGPRVPRLVSLGSGRIGLGAVAPVALQCELSLTLTSDSSYEILREGCYHIYEFNGEILEKTTRIEGFEVLRRSDRPRILDRLSEVTTRVAVTSVGPSQDRIEEVGSLLRDALARRARSAPMLFVLVAENGASAVAKRLGDQLGSSGEVARVSVHPCIVDRIVPEGLVRINGQPVITTESFLDLAISADGDARRELTSLIGTSVHVRWFSPSLLKREEQIKLWAFNGLQAVVAVLCYLAKRGIYLSTYQAMQDLEVRQFLEMYAVDISQTLGNEVQPIVQRNIERLRKFGSVLVPPEFVLKNLRLKLRPWERFLGPLEGLKRPWEFPQSWQLLPSLVLGYVMFLIAWHPASPFSSVREEIGLNPSFHGDWGLLCKAILDTREFDDVATRAAIGVAPTIMTSSGGIQ